MNIFQKFLNLFRKPKPVIRSRLDEIKGEILRNALPDSILGRFETARWDAKYKPIILNEFWMLPPIEPAPDVIRIKRSSPFWKKPIPLSEGSYIMFAHPSSVADLLATTSARTRWQHAWRSYRMWCTQRDTIPVMGCRDVLNLFGDPQL